MRLLFAGSGPCLPATWNVYCCYQGKNKLLPFLDFCGWFCCDFSSQCLQQAYGRAIELDETKIFALVESANIFLMLGSYRKVATSVHTDFYREFVLWKSHRSICIGCGAL